jgi:hypothetical protein
MEVFKRAVFNYPAFQKLITSIKVFLLGFYILEWVEKGLFRIFIKFDLF